MNHEANRLRTFKDWPTAAKIDKVRVAQCGFFYLGRGVEVQCFACNGNISEWNYGDQAMVRHRQLNPQCPFILNPTSSGNIPMGQSSLHLLGDINGVERNVEMASRDDIYKNDALRLLSYVHWPATSPPREEMVLAGFYHLNGERVRCAWCGVEVHRNWSPSDDPFVEHRQVSSHCPYIRHRESAATLTASIALTTAVDTLNTPSLATTMAQRIPINRDLSNLNTSILEVRDVWETLGVVPVGASARPINNSQALQGPRNPNYASVVKRLETFRNWPYNSPLTPTSLAQAGFYFTGTCDQVRCFYCDGGLGRWEPGDNPWSEHKRWFPRCPFLNLARPDPTITRNSNHNDSSNLDNGEALTNYNSRNFLAASLETPADAQSIIVSRSLGDDVWHDWDWEPPNCGQLQYRRSRGKPGTRNGFLPVQIKRTLSTSRKRSSAMGAPGDDDKDEAECFPIGTDLETIVKILQDENRQLKEAKLCKVCMDDEVSTVFLPCGHAAGCGGCAPGLSHCPLCRAEVQALIRAYLP